MGGVKKLALEVALTPTTASNGVTLGEASGKETAFILHLSAF